MYDPPTRTYLARFLADAFLAGAWNERALVDRAGRALDRRPPWLRAVAREVLAAYHRPPADAPRELARFVALTLAGPALTTADAPPPRVIRWLMPVSQMGRRRWPVPELSSPGELADWLGVGGGELAWLADARGLERTVDAERLRHYRYRSLARSGGVPRVIERPKARLKAIQRRILHELLDLIPAHDAAHGFIRGRSAASHAAQHVGRGVVVSADLEDFFASVTAGRVFAIFRTAGYPESVAHALTALTTNVVPAGAWHAIAAPTEARRIDIHRRLGRRLAAPHLPQGAPTSPSLANLAAFGLDRRLTGLAGSLGLTFSRYADDLTFSGEARVLSDPTVLRAAIATIVREEGFTVNHRKSRLVTRAGRQRVCGIVVNERLNVARPDYDTLKAIIHNAAAADLTGQDIASLQAHLQGRIAWVQSLNPSRGEKLRREFVRIGERGP